MAQHHRIQPTTDDHILINSRKARPEQTENAGETRGYLQPHSTIKISSLRHQSTSPVGVEESVVLTSERSRVGEMAGLFHVAGGEFT